MVTNGRTAGGQLLRFASAALTVILTALRLLFGFMFTMSGTTWIFRREDSVGYLRDGLEIALGTPGGVAVYEGFLRNVVLEAPVLFTVLVATGELLSGVALLVGFPPRAGALGGMFLTANYGFAFHSSLLPPGGNFMITALLLPLVSMQPYRHLALRRWPWRRSHPADDDERPNVARDST